MPRPECGWQARLSDSVPRIGAWHAPMGTTNRESRFLLSPALEQKMEETTSPAKRGFLRGIGEFLQTERQVLLSIGFLGGEEQARWRRLQVDVVAEDSLAAGAADDPPRLWIASGLLLLLHEAVSLSVAYLDGSIELQGGTLRSALANGRGGYARHTLHGVIEQEWGDVVLALGGSFGSRVADMTKAATLFVLYHEMAHQLRRHHSARREVPGSALSARRLRRFLEQDADIHAAQFLMQRLMAGPLSVTARGTPRQRLSFLEDALLAIGILFLVEDLRLALGRDVLLAPEHLAGREMLHPLVRWGLAFVLLEISLKHSVHLHQGMPVTSLPEDAAQRLLASIGKLGSFLGFPAERWDIPGSDELVSACIQEFDDWSDAHETMPEVLRGSLAAAYARNHEGRGNRMYRLQIVTDVADTDALRDTLQQAAVAWAEIDGEDPGDDLNFSVDPTDATLVTVAATAVAALCQSMNTFLRERKRRITIRSGDHSYTFENLSAEEVGGILQAGAQLPVARLEGQQRSPAGPGRDADQGPRPERVQGDGGSD